MWEIKQENDEEQIYRTLFNSILRASVYAGGEVIQSDDLPAIKRTIGKWTNWPDFYQKIKDSSKILCPYSGVMYFWLLDKKTNDIIEVVYIVWYNKDFNAIKKLDNWEEYKMADDIENWIEDYGVFIPQPGVYNSESGWLKCYLDKYFWVSPY